MSVDECSKRIKVMKNLIQVYSLLYNDTKCPFYKCSSIREMSLRAANEIFRLEELIHNQELEDSYDQNTGEVYYDKKTRH